MPERDELDLLLDSALASYADPGAHAGLEERVLSALAAERESAKIRTAAPWTRRRLALAIAAPVAASLLLWFSIAKFSHAPSIENNQAHQAPPATSHPAPVNPRAPSARPSLHPGTLKGHDFSDAANAPQSVRASAPEGRSSRTTRVEDSEPLPKLDVFPTPQPLTPQEHSLVVVATQTSLPVREALVQAQSQDEVPVRIAAIHIPPLEPPDPGQP